MVLASYAKENGERYRLLSLNDDIGMHALEVAGLHFSFEGFHRKKAKFFLKVAVLAPQARIVYVGHPNLAPGDIFFRLCRCRSIVASHGIEVWNRQPWWRRLALRLASKMTAPSAFTAQKLVTLQGINPESVTIIPWALDPGFQFIGEEKKKHVPALPPGKMLLSVARLVAGEGYKGIDTVIRALPLVREAYSDLYYVVLGDGDDLPRLRQVAKDVGVAGHVFFLGNATDGDLQVYYRNCDIFVMPSKGEGFGLVFIEAMAFGKPVIGGKHAGTLDVIVDGETGFMVEYGDIPGLAQCLIHLLGNEGLRHQMGEAGRRRVQAFYSFSRFKKNLVNVLNGSRH